MNTEEGTTQSAAQPFKCWDDGTPPTALLTSAERNPLVIVIGTPMWLRNGWRIWLVPHHIFMFISFDWVFGNGCCVYVISASV